MNKLFIIDGNAYIHRAYHALPPLTTSRGEQVNAVYGFVRMLLKILKKEKPDYLAVCFDAPGKTFRHDVFNEYKATRKETEPELVGQFPLSKESAGILGLKTIEKDGYEADDIIAALVKNAVKKGYEVVIVSGDKDVLQLVSDGVKVLNEHRSIIYDRDEIHKKYGIYPEELNDMFALCGDVSDNVPGVPGIGEKTAVKLIQQYGSLENVLENCDKIQAKLADKLSKNRDKAILSKQLVTLDAAVPVETDMEMYRVKEPDQDKLIQFVHRMEFSSFLKEYIVKHEVKVNCHTITGTGDLDMLVNKLSHTGKFAVNLEMTHPESLVGISICFEPMSAYYIPVGHNYLGVTKQLDREYVLNKLKPVFESNEIKKYVHNLKFNLLFFHPNIDLKGGYFDTMIASYLLNPSKSNHSLDTIAFDYLREYKGTPVEDLTGKGKSQKTVDKVSIESFAEYACAGCDGILRLSEALEPMLKKKKLYGLLHDVEMPLAGVLADMEEAGIRVDVKYLNKLSKEFNENIVRLVKEVYSLAGSEFNLNSPRQLGFILFEKHKLPVVRRTKTGYSTDEEVLKALSSSSQLAVKILEYRELQKLKSTYIDALVNLVDRETGRIHTSFNQTVTSTGRLSSSEPNLQNIPIRTELGRKIRRAFIPEEGCRFISADYSQIDLRVLAHLSGDKILCKAFESGDDVHNSTACEIFGVAAEEVTGELRRIAKTINFGIVYGMSAYGLSQQLGISTDEAQKHINNYFNKYSGVKAWIENIIKMAHKDGYVTTLLNRIRYLPDINSKNKQMKSFAERTAVNTPVQGGASDIIKIAMININKYLELNNFKSKMLLQVHDELLFEVPEDEIAEVANMVKTKMESAIKIDVPLVVDIKYGKNWNEMNL